MAMLTEQGQEIDGVRAEFARGSHNGILKAQSLPHMQGQNGGDLKWSSKARKKSNFSRSCHITRTQLQVFGP